MNILVIGAHPDDMVCMCGGTLLKYKEQGHKIFVALTTSGNTGSNVIPTKEEVEATREGEASENAKGYKAELRFMRFEDQGLYDTEELRQAVLEALHWAEPDVIFTHAPWDASTDHSVTGALVIRMMREEYAACSMKPSPKKTAPHIFFFDDYAAIDFEPDTYVDITDYIDQKLQLIACHQSQFIWCLAGSEFDEDTKTTARLRGIQAGCQYAESFLGYREKGFFADYRLLPS